MYMVIRMATAPRMNFTSVNAAKKVVIAAEFDSHSCSPKIIDHKSLQLDYYFI